MTDLAPDEMVCPEPDCDAIVKKSWKRSVHDGFILWRDPDTGHIKHRDQVDREQASDWASKKKPGKKARRPKGIEKALLDILDNPGDAVTSDASRRELIRLLARMAEEGGNTGLKAIEMAGQLSGKIFKSIKPPGPHEACRLCGRTAKAPKIVISREMAESQWQE